MPSNNSSPLFDVDTRLDTAPNSSSPKSAEDRPPQDSGDKPSIPATSPEELEIPVKVRGEGKINKQGAVQGGGIIEKVFFARELWKGSCLLFFRDPQFQPTLAIKAAVGLLLRGTYASFRMPYSWGYIDRPADGAVHLIFVGPQMAFPDDGVRFQEKEQRFVIDAGNGREVEMAETKFGFIPDSGATIASRVRRKFRLIKGGIPELVLVHYDQGPPMAVNPDLDKPTRMYPLQDVNLPAVYVAGEKAGQKAMSGAAHNFPFAALQAGAPGIFLQALLGYPPEHTSPEPSPHVRVSERQPFVISDEGGILFPRRRRKPSELRSPQPSKKRRIGVPSHQSAEPPVPPQIENRQLSMYRGVVSDAGFSQTTQGGVDQGKAQSQGKGSRSNTHHELLEGQTGVPEQRQTMELSTGSSLQHPPTAVPVTPLRLTMMLGVGTKYLSARGSSVLISSNQPAWRRLSNNVLLPHEIIPLVREVFMSKDQVKAICDLHGNDAQNFINVIHEALNLPDLLPRLREKCLAALCRICGRQGLLPRTLRVSVYYDRSEAPLYHGGFADVWKGEYRGSHVAVKVLRTYSTTDLGKITNRFCKEVVTWNALCHPNVLSLWGVIMDKGRCAMVSEWMANGNINEFVKEHWEVNRFELLKDVAEGLIYIHCQGMTHGDLKGANILVGQNGRAKLADFGLLTIVSEPTYFTTSTSTTMGGTIRWMSPELLHPELFGLDHSRPTKESDCYALGMVTYEVLSGRAPFALEKEYIVIRKVLEGGHPEKPEGAIGARFTADLWEMLNLCWTTKAQSRPSIEAVLECFGRISSAWKPLPPQMDKGVEEGEGDWDLSVLQV